MSAIISPTDPLFSIENAAGGLDIQGFEDQENSLVGTDGNDSIIGGALSDTLFGGDGADTLIGGPGADTFVFDRDALGVGGIDQLPDFDPTEDSLAIAGLLQGDNVDFDRSTGILTLNGQAFAQIDPTLPLGDNQLDFDDLIFDGVVDDGVVDDVVDDGGDSGTLVGTDGEADVFAFDRDTAFTSGEIIPIEGFEPGVDTLQINGTLSGDNVDINRSNGIISINGQAFAQIDPDVAQDISENTDFDLM